jgi:uracil-DNA glycosylase
LRRELAPVRPRLIVALGGDAHTAMADEYRHAAVVERRRSSPPPVLPADGLAALRLPHPSSVKILASGRA